jgi:hypothetical protein
VDEVVLPEAHNASIALGAGSKTSYAPAIKEEDKLFTIRCFFINLSDLQEYLKKLREDYREGKVDLQTASVVTDAAFEVVEKAAKDLQKDIPPPAVNTSDDVPYYKYESEYTNIALRTMGQQLWAFEGRRHLQFRSL